MHLPATEFRKANTLSSARGAGAESSDSTLAEGRAALDEATRNILFRISGRGYTFAVCPSGEEKA